MLEPLTTLHHLKYWPTQQWRQQYLLAPSIVLLSESALLHVYQHPAALREISVPTYVLVDELNLLRLHFPIFAEDTPAGLIQVNAAQWVELTLNSQPVLVWDDSVMNVKADGVA
ncbi:MAG TPA: hypothetical protein VFM61_09855 [Pseudidiomarina sp.]|nr:hypothetical protein [Pseudidiomarina sp.]